MKYLRMLLLTIFSLLHCLPNAHASESFSVDVSSGALQSNDVHQSTVVPQSEVNQNHEPQYHQLQADESLKHVNSSADNVSPGSEHDAFEPLVEVIYNDDRDPFEGFNRAMWDLNYRYLDKYFFRPVAHGYQDYVPRTVKMGVNNFVLNFEEPSALVNNALQGKWGWAANAGGRFTINSTLGILGFVDVADMMGLERKHDDFNEVLGYYGVPNGPYFMAPFFGPYVTREITTDWVDGLYFPLSEFTFWQSVVKWGLKNLHTRASAIDQERLLDNALDPYIFVKEAYFQHLDYKVYDGDVPVNYEEDELLDEYMDELD